MRIARLSRSVLAAVTLTTLVATSGLAGAAHKKEVSPEPASIETTYYLHFTNESPFVCCGYMDFDTTPTAGTPAFVSGDPTTSDVTSHTFPAREGTPFVLDATKQLRVAFRIASTISAAATFRVTVSGLVAGQEREIASGSQQILASVNTSDVVDLKLDPDPSLHLAVVDSLSLRVEKTAGVSHSQMSLHEPGTNTQEAFLAVSQMSSTAVPNGSVDVGPVNCSQTPPESIPTIPADTSTDLPLEVRVVVEPADRELAETYVASATEIYDRIGITLKASYDEMPDPTSAGSGGVAEDLNALRDVYGGARPAGVDVVYLFTRNFAGGYAGCVGGVRDANLAFAFGSIDYEGSLIGPEAPRTLLDEGIIMAHEIGHLLGGHHHYGNCAEALPGGVARAEAGLCTVMSPAALTLSKVFGTVETAFIRDYASRFAKG